jgi:hypothetical protein
LIANLEKQLRIIEDGVVNTPDDLGLLKNQMEVENKCRTPDPIMEGMRG